MNSEPHQLKLRKPEKFTKSILLAIYPYYKFPYINRRKEKIWGQYGDREEEEVDVYNIQKQIDREIVYREEQEEEVGTADVNNIQQYIERAIVRQRGGGGRYR